MFFLALGNNHTDICTMARQLKMLQHGYSREEFLEFRPFIWRYLLETSRRTVQGLRNAGLEPATYANKVCSFLLHFHPRRNPLTG
jgi:hypothetical protein